MGERLVTLAEVEERIAHHRDDALPPELQAQWERDLGASRARMLRRTTLNAAAVYNLFLVCDLLATPDTLALSVALHLLVVTPYLLLVAWIMNRAPAPRLREALVASAPIAMSVQILIVFCATRSPYAASYMYLVTQTVITMNLVQRPGYDEARIGAVVAFLMLVSALIYRRDLPIEVAAMHCITYVICVIATLNANMALQREQQWRYLTGLQDRLRAELSDSHANFDPMTGLGNRRYLATCVNRIWSAGGESRATAAVLFDVDHFKSFNDRYGHARGDACLRRLAACATAELRDSDDLAFRYGGEEFLLLMPGADLVAAKTVAERIRAAIEQLSIPHEDGANGFVTASFGVSAAAVPGCSSDALIEAADAALYAAKRAGRNRTCVAPPQKPDLAA